MLISVETNHKICDTFGLGENPNVRHHMWMFRKESGSIPRRINIIER